MKSILTSEALQELCSDGKPIVLNFHADWCEPCGAMNSVFSTLQAIHSDVTFALVDVEQAEALCEQLNVTAVPTYLLLSSTLAEQGRVNGADAAALSAAVGSVSAEGGERDAAVDMQARLVELTTQDAVVLFMKGDRDAPQCGFSAKMIELLAKHSEQVPYTTFDILGDPAVRQALKEFANWPTYPQLWASGELLGGLDVAAEMDEDDELLPLLTAAVAKKTAAVDARIKAVISGADTVLVMKGDKAAPKCKFSRAMVALLAEHGVDEYATFDILTDPDFRARIKVYSDFPTFPQLYVAGELIGGLDIAKELAEEGELKSTCAVNKQQ